MQGNIDAVVVGVGFAPDRNTDRILSEINRAISIFAGQVAAKQQKLEETVRKIETNAATYIEDAVSIQRDAQRRNNFNGKAWYAIGFTALVCTENLNPHIMVMKSAKDRV